MTKRISSLFLSALLLLSLVATAFAAPSESGAGIVVDASLSGSTATVEVSATGAGGATNGRIVVTYDPSLYTYLSAEPADPAWIVSINTSEEGKVSFAWVGSVLPSGQAAVVTLTFQAVGAPKAAAFTASAEELYQSGVPVPGCDGAESPSDSGTVAPRPSRPGPSGSAPSGSDPTPEPPANPFRDIENNWAKDVILEAYGNGWILGMTATTYEPDQTANRAQFATIMWRVADTPAPTSTSPFTDVPSGAYYETSINWGHQIGMIKGTSGTTADPERNITRQEAVVMLYRYAGYVGADVSGRGSLSEFHDQNSVSDWARDAVEWAVSNGVIQGTPGKLLEPTRNISRSEMAAIIVRFTAMI